MTSAPILSTLRELQVLVINPPGAESDALALQLMRIGCSVRQLWPPTESLEHPVDLIFTGIFQNRHHDQIHQLVRGSDPRTTLIALVDYESPSVLSQLLELGVHGAITQPLDSHRVLPALVAARRNSEEMAKLQFKNAQLLERLEHQADINRAKAMLMKINEWEESEAHGFLSREAMNRRESLLTIAREYLKQLDDK